MSGRKLKDIMEELTELYPELKRVLLHSQYKSYDDLSGCEWNTKDPEERFLRTELMYMLEKLDDITDDIEYLNKSIKYQGKLHKQPNGRYEVGGYELSSGYGVEVLTPCMIWDADIQDEVEGFEWVSSRVEYDHGKHDYYLVGHSDIDLEGLTARVRR